MDGILNWTPHAELFPKVGSYEFLGFITGIFSVLLLIFVRQPRVQWTAWIASIVSAAIYFYLFKEWTLYGNMALQVPFFLISVQGAWMWRGQLGFNASVPEIPTTFASKMHWRLATVAALVAMIVVYPLLDHYNDASPLWDGLILTISLAAIYLQLRKYVQCWYLWIAVDVIAVPFHISQDHAATGILYLCYGIMCLFGLRTWWNEAKENEYVAYQTATVRSLNAKYDQPWNRDFSEDA